MKKKSLKKNAMLNMVKNIVNLLFPLVTFPYLTRILGVENLGKYNFAIVFVSYFTLIAGLGVSTYAVREGAKYRGDKSKFNNFVKQVFTINIISTIIAYCALFVCMVIFENLSEYRVLIVISSLGIVFTTIGVEWVYSIYEDYTYITLINVIFKFLSLILTFIFVKTEGDINKYAIITLISSVAVNLLYIIRIKKYCSLGLCRVKYCKRHIKSIMILFASTIAVTIYVSSDTTILGIIKGDYSVGIYSVSVKVYTILKNIVASLLIVSIPRLSSYYSNKQFDKFDETIQNVINSISIIMLPIVVGVFMLRIQIIDLIAGKAYRSASISLIILCITLIFCIYGWIFNQCILLSVHKEKIIFNATIISALINIILNILLIPIWAENAAAFTTLISEFVIFVICYLHGRKYSSFKVINRNLVTVIFACFGIIITCLGAKIIIKDSIMYIIITILFSCINYFGLLVIMKNTIVVNNIKSIYFKFKNKIIF